MSWRGISAPRSWKSSISQLVVLLVRGCRQSNKADLRIHSMLEGRAYQQTPDVESSQSYQHHDL